MSFWARPLTRKVEGFMLAECGAPALVEKSRPWLEDEVADVVDTRVDVEDGLAGNVDAAVFPALFEHEGFPARRWR